MSHVGQPLRPLESTRFASEEEEEEEEDLLLISQNTKREMVVKFCGGAHKSTSEPQHMEQQTASHNSKRSVK